MNDRSIPGLALRDTLFDGEQARILTAELQQEYVQRYGGPDETPVDPREFDRPAGSFLIAELNGDLVGCAGLRRHDHTTVELKRMFVRAPFRRQGLARVLLNAIHDRALELGYERLILETGSKQPEALALYLAEGYRPHENVGHYRHSDLARSFVRELAPVPEP